MKTRKTRSPAAMDQPTQTLKEIDQEIAKLKERAASIVAAEKDGVIERMKEAIAYYGLTATDLGLSNHSEAGQRGRTRKSTKISATATARGPAKTTPPSPTAKKSRAGAGGIKFRDDSGNTWSGFGPKPRWLTDALANGKALEELKA
jgi:DNA-binding protein H-NS